MKRFILLCSLISITAGARTAGIAGWKQTQGITEQEAMSLAQKAIEEELLYSDDGDVCGVDDVWGWEREPDVIANFPEKRGPIFALSVFVQGPHEKMNCAGHSKYGCRTVFSKPPAANVWGVEYVECEPVN